MMLGYARADGVAHSHYSMTEHVRATRAVTVSRAFRTFSLYKMLV